jgi:hypothetical protein
MVSFTGSTRAGILVDKAAAETVKKVALELGGKSPNIILDGAPLEQAVAHGVLVMMNNTGQSCNAPSRMLVPRKHLAQVEAISAAIAATVATGDPADPSTSIVFGEKGSGKTALKLQMVRQFERHNDAQPDGRTFVVLYDDFNPFLDRFVSRVGKGRPVEKSLAQWKLWDHMDAILTLAVTQLVTAVVEKSSKPPRLTRPAAPSRSTRSRAKPGACWDESRVSANAIQH